MCTSQQRAVWLGIIIGLSPGVAAWSQPTTAPGAAGAATQPALDPEVNKILIRLEQREVRDLRADLTWRKRDILDLDEDMVTKRGRIWYQRAEPVAKFLIHFKDKISNQRKDKLDERHMFDGRWYVELQARTKTYTRREVRRPDDPGDPYKVGQGVFPLPFGQKKADILREFDAQRAAPAPDDPPLTDHLRLLPRVDTQTGRTYKQLDFWIGREGPTAGLPIKVRVAKRDGTGKVATHITIAFDDVELNQGFSASVFQLKCPRGYESYEERLKPAAPPPHAGPKPAP